MVLKFFWRESPGQLRGTLLACEQVPTQASRTKRNVPPPVINVVHRDGRTGRADITLARTRSRAVSHTWRPWRHRVHKYHCHAEAKHRTYQCLLHSLERDLWLVSEQKDLLRLGTERSARENHAPKWMCMNYKHVVILGSNAAEMNIGVITISHKKITVDDFTCTE